MTQYTKDLRAAADRRAHVSDMPRFGSLLLVLSEWINTAVARALIRNSNVEKAQYARGEDAV